MDNRTVHGSQRGVWSLAARQHGVVSRRQLLDLGWHPETIKHRLRKGRLHRVHRGVYAVGRPELTKEGLWMAAVLACGPTAVLSHFSAAALWGIRQPTADSVPKPVHVSVDVARRPRCRGVRLHRVRALPASDRRQRDRIPVTSPARTLIDLAIWLRAGELERATNEADRLGLADPESLRAGIEERRGQPGVARLAKVLDRRTFTLTDSELERRFLRLVHRAGLPRPLTQHRVNGVRVDFYWPELRLVVETDGLRYHRTPAQQSRDRVRDQRHVAGGLIPIRFTHAQVAFQAGFVMETLRAVIMRQRPKLWTA